MTNEHKQNIHKHENEKTAKMAGTGAGIVAGAQVGTVLLPIPVVGTFTGALVGGVIGSKIGQKVGGAIMERWNAPDQSHKAGPDLATELQKLVELKEKGILSEEEFKAAKAKLLGL